MSESVQSTLSFDDFFSGYDGFNELEAPSGSVLYPNLFARGSYVTKVVKEKRVVNGKIQEYSKNPATSNDFKLQDTMVEIFSDKRKKNGVNIAHLIKNAETELEKKFIEKDLIVKDSNTAKRNEKIKKIRQVAISDHIFDKLYHLLPEVIEIDPAEFISRTKISRIQGRFNEALELLDSSADRMVVKTGYFTMNKEFTDIQNTIFKGSLVPSFEVKMKSSFNKYLPDGNPIATLEKLMAIKVSRKQKYVDKFLLKIDRKAFLMVLGAGIWEKSGHTFGNREHRDFFKNRGSHSLDLLVRSFLSNGNHIAALKRFTFEELKGHLHSSHLSSWSKFRAGVLLPAIEDLNKISDMEVSYFLYPNHNEWTHIELRAKFKTGLVNVEQTRRYDPLAYVIASRHFYFQKNSLTGTFLQFVPYVHSLIYKSRDKDEIYGKTLLEWKAYGKKCLDTEIVLKQLMIEYPNVFESGSYEYDKNRMCLVINNKENMGSRDLFYKDEDKDVEGYVSTPKKVKRTTSLITSPVRVTDTLSSLAFITNHLLKKQEIIEKPSITDFIPFYFASVSDGSWRLIEDLKNDYMPFKTVIRKAIYEKKISYFTFPEIQSNGKMDIEHKSEAKRVRFLEILEGVGFKEVDDEFKKAMLEAMS